MSRLEEISALLENPETGLEDTIRLVEEGLKLVKSGREMLDAAELRIKVLENPPAQPAKAGKNNPVVQDENDFSLI